MFEKFVEGMILVGQNEDRCWTWALQLRLDQFDADKSFASSWKYTNRGVSRDRLAQSGEHLLSNPAIRVRFSRWEILCARGRKTCHLNFIKNTLTNETRWTRNKYLVSAAWKGNVARINWSYADGRMHTSYTLLPNSTTNPASAFTLNLRQSIVMDQQQC